MPSSIESLAQELLSLPGSDRAFLAHRLIASLDDTVDENAEAEWMQEIERRVEDITQGKVQCRSVDEVLQELRARAR